MIWTETPDAPRCLSPAPSSIGTRSLRRPLRAGAPNRPSVESSPLSGAVPPSSREDQPGVKASMAPVSATGSRDREPNRHAPRFGELALLLRHRLVEARAAKPLERGGAARLL